MREGVLIEGIREATLVAIPMGSEILDYGAGAGALSAYLLSRGHRVTAVDVDPGCKASILARCNAEMRARLEFVHVDPLADLVSDDPLGSRMFDFVVCREVLEHVLNPWKLLRLLSRHLRAGGTVVVSFPNPAVERWLDACDPKWMEKSGHCRFMDAEAFRREAEQSGFAIRASYGAGSEWSILWALLAPLRFPHRMGNPTGPFAGPASALALACSALRRIPPLARWLDRRVPKSLVFEAQKTAAPAPGPREAARRPTVLLVYDYRDWILYQWAVQIRRAWDREFDFMSVSMFHAAADRRLRRRLVAAADVVHLLLPHATEMFLDTLDERFVGTIHHWVDYETVRRTAQSMARIVTGAEEWRERLAARGTAPSRITVVHSGAPDEFFARPREDGQERPLRVGFSAKADSNEADRKGTRHFVSLAKLCARSDGSPRVQFVISGPGWDDVADELRAAGTPIEYHPRVADMPEFMRSLDVYLMLSDLEGGPATVAEAMASGCVVVATRIALARDVIEDGATGYFVENQDTKGILALLDTLAGDRRRMRAIGEAAARFADANLRYASTMAPLGPLYRDVASLAAGLRSAILPPDELKAQEEINRAMAPSAWT